MKRMLICTFVCLMLSSVTNAQESRFKSLWPFGKDRATTPRFNNIDPFTATRKPVPEEKKFGFPSPTKMIDSAEKRTEAVFQKTRETWKGVQDLGKAMNPFAAKPKRKKKKSFLDTFFPKQPVTSGSATVNDFLEMDRPGF